MHCPMLALSMNKALRVQWLLLLLLPQVRLNESQSKHKLYFGNLPRSYTQKQLEDELNKVVKGRLSAYVTVSFVDCLDLQR